MGAFHGSSRNPVSTARPQTFLSIEYGFSAICRMGRLCSFGVDDGLVAGEREVANGRDALQLGRERGDGRLEAHLVVALAGAAVGDRVGAHLDRDAGEVPGDDRAAERRDQRVALLVQRVGLQRGHQVVGGELVLRVDDDRLDGAAVERALADVLHVFAALADVDREGDDILARRVVQPADANRGVEAARVGEDNALCHVSPCCSIESLGVGRLSAARAARPGEPSGRAGGSPPRPR